MPRCVAQRRHTVVSVCVCVCVCVCVFVCYRDSNSADGIQLKLNLCM